jgi:hypothetical protein
MSAAREPFPVSHVLFELCDHPENGATFALIAAKAPEAKYRQRLFSGHIEAGMAAALRRLADRIEKLEPRPDMGRIP